MEGVDSRRAVEVAGSRWEAVEDNIRAERAEAERLGVRKLAGSHSERIEADTLFDVVSDHLKGT